MTNRPPPEFDVDELEKLDVDPDTVFEVLSKVERRFVLACLKAHSGPLPLSDIADELSVWKKNAPIDQISPDAVKSEYLSLYHQHIPKLAGHGIVQYSQSRDSVTLTPLGEKLAATLESPMEQSQSPNNVL